MGKVWIPKLSYAEVIKRSKKIKPVVSFTSKRGKLIRTEGNRGRKYFIKKQDLFGVAYTWEPKPLKLAPNLKVLKVIQTYHTYGYYGLFKPSIAEVLRQIPKEDLDKVVAFEIVDRPQDAADLNNELEALHAGYHVAKTALYVRA